MQRISGKNFDISIGDLAICVSKTTLTIEDKTEVAKDGGVPNGWVDGEVAASGDLELDALATWARPPRPWARGAPWIPSTCSSTPKPRNMKK